MRLDILEFLILRRIRSKRKRNKYIRDIFKNRLAQGELFLVRELEGDPYYHHRYFRMDKNSFDYLLQRISHRISHPRNHAYPIPPIMRLSVALRYIATGASHVSLAMNFRISPSSVSLIVKEVLSAIWEELMPEYMPVLNTNDWIKKSEEFFDLWNFPMCCGALDGKHIRIRSFDKSGSENFNYKKYFSILLLIAADAKYKIIFCDIGACGSSSDSGVLETTEFGKQLYNNTLSIPAEAYLPNSTTISPFVFLGDGGFPLRNNLMKPYPFDDNSDHQRKIFNYRLSRARRVSENAFGILAARFRIFHTPIDASFELCNSIVKATTVLHNFLMEQSDLFEISTDVENNGNVCLGNWRDICQNDAGYAQANQLGSNNYSRCANSVRETFAEWFMQPTNGLSWQDKYVERQ